MRNVNLIVFKISCFEQSQAQLVVVNSSFISNTVDEEGGAINLIVSDMGNYVMKLWRVVLRAASVLEKQRHWVLKEGIGSLSFSSSQLILQCSNQMLQLGNKKIL